MLGEKTMLEKQWLYTDIEDLIDFSDELNLSPFMAKILIERGIDTSEKINAFLYGTHENLHSPWLLPDMKNAVSRIVEAISRQEKITIYGDYDVDGQTASALLVRVLQQLSSDPSLIEYYVPHRMEQGYGLHKDALATISQESSLVITVDCGIAAIEESEYANSIGLDLIITDHHKSGPKLPKTLAVINPKREDSEYPFADLAGVGVAYKLVQALGEHYKQDFSELIDLVALGTVVDIVPLIDENRIFVKLGLLQLQKSEVLGLRQLVKVSDLKSPFKASDFGFKLGPRLNAVGRMGESTRGIKLLLTNNQDEATSLAQILERENSLRQQTEAKICEEAIAIVEEHEYHLDPVIVVTGDQWHPGVIGIVASRLVEKYYRPTIVIAISDGVGKGSARSIKGFNLYQGLTACKNLLTAFGGHEMAAGMTIAAENIDELRKQLIIQVENQLQPEDFIPKLRIDYKLKLGQINQELLDQLALLEPFGMGNPTPNFAISGAVLNRRMIGATGDHVRLVIQDQQGKQVEAVGFGMYHALEKKLKYRECMKFAVYPQKGFNNPNKTEVILRDFQPVIQHSNLITRWITEKYPWDIPENYNQISHLQMKDRAIPNSTNFSLDDRRGVWAREQELQQLNANKRVLIYVATPLKAIELCRQLRINIPRGSKFIGFEHELLTDEERQELKDLIDEGVITWVVSTGLWKPEWDWHHVVLCNPFCNDILLWSLINQTSDSIIALYGKADYQWLQQHLYRLFPDRTLLAKYYLAMVGQRQSTLSRSELREIADEFNLGNSLDLILAVFNDLNLIKHHNDNIEIMPKPASKLDLTDSVSYNEGITKREQYLSYLQHCLERGFFDEFRKKNSGNR